MTPARPTIEKHREDVPADFFAAEARGLARLREAGGLRVPTVHAVDACSIQLEDLGQGRRGADYWRRAARGLARQHTQVATAFGFDQRGFCGDTPQDNTWDADGRRFFVRRRLVPQMRLARDRGLLTAADAGSIQSVCDELPQRIPDMPPVLLHGDLWAGNLHACADGEPALIDAAAVHFGWAEAELAMLTLFGTPPDAFFVTYAEHATLRDDWRERIPVYNLYHLLNHLNLFGRSYLPAVQRALSAVG